jgi:hypothetical protein
MEGDRDVERDPVHPGREPEALIESVERAPELGGHRLDQVLAVGRVPAVSVRDLAEDLLVLLEQGHERLFPRRFRHGATFVLSRHDSREREENHTPAENGQLSAP